MTYQNIYVIPDQGAMGGGNLYDKFGNLSYFADVESLVNLTKTGVDLSVSVSSYSRGRFMRDPSKSSVKATTRYLSSGLRQTKGAIPGYTITLESGDEKRQFQYTGTMSGLVAWLKDTAKVDINLYGPTGTPYDPIPAAEAAV